MCHAPFVETFDVRICSFIFFQLKCLIQNDISIWPFSLAFEWKHWMTDGLSFNDSIHFVTYKELAGGGII